MHIVLVCREYVGSARGGGIGSYMQEIAKAYVAKSHKVTVVTASDDTKKEYESISPEGIKVISLSGGDFLVPAVEGASKIKKLRCIYRFYSYRKKLREKIESIHGIDIIEVADYGAEALYLNNLNVPVVIRLHTPQSFCRDSFKKVTPKWWMLHRNLPINAENTIFNNSRYITGCSQSLLDWVEQNYDISKAKTAVIKNPVSVPDFNLPKKNNSIDSKTIFYAGTISDTKGVGELVDACIILRGKGLDIKLKLAGKDGSYHNSLQTKVIENNWNWIEFLGKLPREEVYRCYASADVCCFPSWWENMPMVVLESMALGAIVVATDAGGTPEIITDGSNGFLSERKNPRKLADVLYRALSLIPERRSEISQNAKQTIRDNFSIDKISNEMLDFFNKVIADFKS